MMRRFSILAVCAAVFFIAVSTTKPATADGLPWWGYVIVIAAGLG